MSSPYTVTLDAQALALPYAQACAQLDDLGFAEAVWSGHLHVWSADPAVQRAIAGRLGWLRAVDFVAPHLPRLESFAESIRGSFERVVLLGMGGSSLAPEVMRQVLGVAPGYPAFEVLDSVDPDAVRPAFARPESTLFIVASKSGSTIEPTVMAAEAARRVRALRADWGSQFVAITDSDTVLHRRALDAAFRDVFINPADIGGRYSALSFFGMVPAAVMGIELRSFLAPASEMIAECRSPAAADNPALALGAFMAAGVRAGRDKLTLLTPPRLQPFGLWVEQLVAESTGKQGTGIVPIAGEPASTPLGEDRMAVAIALGADGPDPLLLERVAAARVPLATVHMRDAVALGAEFFRWELATAAAGALLRINPFDEPNVQQAKDATRALLDAYRASGRLPLPEAHGSADGIRLTLSTAAEHALSSADPLAFLQAVRERDYVALLAFLPPGSTPWQTSLDAFRARIAVMSGCATMLGYGPRYLHSTGQLHKGGPDTGVFLVITAEQSEDLAIPGEPFSFGLLELAQAVGDFQSLDRAGRRALLVHLPRRDPALLDRIGAALTARAVPRLR